MEDPILITEIEKALYSMARHGDDEMGDTCLEEYFFTYYSQKLILSNHIYSHMESSIPDYTDHSIKHVNRILKILKKMLLNNVLYLEPYRDYQMEAPQKNEIFNFYEIYLLLSATIWHDVKNIMSRNDHENNIDEILNRTRLFFIDEDMHKYTIAIAESHRGDDAIRNKVPLNPSYKGEELNLRFLAAILRLADELEEGQNRVDTIYYETKKESISLAKRLFWEIGYSIRKIEPQPKERVIKVNAILKNEETCFKIYPKVQEAQEHKDKSVTLIDELIYRINKINETRKNYMKYVTKYILFDKIEFELRIGDWTTPYKFTFDDNNGYSKFWDHFSQLDPRKEIKDYCLQQEEKK